MDSLLDADPVFLAEPVEGQGFFDCEFMEVSPAPPAFFDHPSTSEEGVESPSASPMRLDPDLPFPSVSEDVSASIDDAFTATYVVDAPVSLEPGVDMREDAPVLADVAPPLEAARGRKRKLDAEPNVKVAKVKLEGSVAESSHSVEEDEYAHVTAALANPSLSAAEKNELRRQLRLLKNRESAQASRLRKKTYIEELERKVSALTSENQRLRTSITTLNTENTSLKSQVGYLHQFASSTGLGSLLQQGAALVQKTLQKPQQPGSQGAGAGTQPSINPRAAGMVLMVVLFSFGLLFNPQTLNQKQMPMSTALAPASPSRVMTHPDFQPTSESRPLHALHGQSVPQRVLKRIEEHAALPTAASHTINAAASPPPLASPVISDWKANTTYLLCPEVRKLTPPAETPSDPDAPLQVAFLIPPDALEGSPSPRPRHYLEVTCRVTGVATRPLAPPADAQVQA